MRMLTKFESKSPRVKGVAFHPKLPLLLASLHNGTIQLWNYQMGTLVERFEEHDGPVRGICFHPTQPIFASAADDYKIKVWNYKTKKCLFTMNGHLDYVRTVFFHHEYPWIISASDDQTIRIWNWQSRNCIAILTGHNHYVMCAQFHPKEDLVVSASMDLTVRVWDISGLRKKNTSHQPMSFEEQMARANAGQADLFGSTDAVVKYVLEGHDRGVNWASFHPTLPLIVSSSDDRQIKLWRMSDTKAWEVDTCRGHFNNVLVGLFHPRHELILSAGEDKTIRIWDMGKRTPVQTFRREHDRFWGLIAHPELNLFAAAHDNGVIVFKLERERPAFSLYQEKLFYVREKTVRVHDLSNGSDIGVMNIKKLGPAHSPALTLSYNPAEKSILVSEASDGGIFDFFRLPQEGIVGDSNTDAKRGQGTSMLFVARNRFAVFNKATQTIEIRDLSFSIVKSFKVPVETREIFYGGTACVLLAGPTSISLFDLQQQRVLNELTTQPIKYVIWNADNSQVALLGKHTITIANKSLDQSCMIHETIRIKSAAWDDSGILVYTTLNHIKYTLTSGDTGIIKTLDQPIYLTRIKGKIVHCLDRAGRPRTIEIDPTEYRFKLALAKENFDEMLQIIRTSNLVGQSIIAYLQKKGYAEIALHFVQDQSTRFDLAIECGNLDVALEMARAVEKQEVWVRLAEQALKQGAQKIVEIAYQKTKNLDRLSFLYLITGNQERLKMMQTIAGKRGDQMARFQNSLYLGDVEERVNVLREVGMDSLAYFAAKTAGLEEAAEGILENAGMTEEDVPKRSFTRSTLAPPTPITQSFRQDWPSKSTGENFFARTLTGGSAAPALPVSSNEAATAGAAELSAWGADNPLNGDDGQDDEEEGEGWDLDNDVPDHTAEAEEAEVEEAIPEDDTQAGTSEYDIWIRNSPLAADRVAAGSFETAMKLLNQQIAAVNFEPLKPLFLSTYQASHVYIQGNGSVDPIKLYARRNPQTTSTNDILPAVRSSLNHIVQTDLQEAYNFVKKGKFAEAETLFRSVLQSMMLVVVNTDAQVQQVREVIDSCREYILGMTMEIERRRLAKEEPENVRRQLELAAYFANCKLQPIHLQLALRSAMSVWNKAQNYATAAVFARRLIALNPTNPTAVTQARSIITQGDRNPQDTLETSYDHFTEFDICAGSLTPIYKGSPVVKSLFSQASYLPEYRGSVCTVDQVVAVGQAGSGLRSKI
ncbi:coatomer protein subunit alpha [Phaffia rhodozyma]|uniref:Coatomer subunit alpha n=1 Tax=Phaffia rhodozyma TaxID=264483 RepID=A0A0F7SNQ0_PHARH|nr:coatomer protein subunit alpha [Phaffia rhodozyma]